MSSAPKKVLDTNSAIQASAALALLTPDQKRTVLKYYHAKDAKMSLASVLLKRHAISALCAIPWTAATLGRGKNGKPCHAPVDVPGGRSRTVAFNVSHQAGLVTLVASPDARADVGTDIVCVNERNDYAFLDRDGFFAWIDAYADVFAPAEICAMKFSADNLGLPEHIICSGPARDAISNCQRRNILLEWKDPAGEARCLPSNVVIDAKLRRFYAYWCLREAYAKMTGDALLADWLRQLEFRDVKVPVAAGEATDNSILLLGEVISDFDIYFNGRKVLDVSMELRAFGRDYMVGSAARPGTGTASFTGYSMLDFERDIAPKAVG
jgi:4'-phosphopantetheinyl transferase